MKLIKWNAMVTNKNFFSNNWNFDSSSFFCERNGIEKSFAEIFENPFNSVHFLFLPTRETVTKVFIRFLRWPFFKRTIIFLRKFSFYEFTDVFTTRNLTLRLHSSYSLWKVIYVTRLLNMPRIDEIDQWRFELCSRYLNVTFSHWIRIICKILGKYDII